MRSAGHTGACIRQRPTALPHNLCTPGSQSNRGLLNSLSMGGKPTCAAQDGRIDSMALPDVTGYGECVTPGDFQ